MDVIGMENPAEAAADLLIVVGFSLIAVVYFAGRLSDRIGRKPLLIASGVLGALGIMLLFFSRSYLHIMLCGSIIGIANGILLSTSWALATDMVGKGEEAKYLGLTNLAMCAGSALARLTGPVIDFFNSLSVNQGYSVMFLICLLCYAAGTLLLLRLRRI